MEPERRRAQPLRAPTSMFDGFKTRQRVRDVEEGLETVQRQLKGMQIEWQNVLDQLKSMVSRVAKDRERAEKARAASPQDERPEPEETAESPGLSGRAAEINQRILERRRRMQ